jgi:hypothetical protein
MHDGLGIMRNALKHPHHTDRPRRLHSEVCEAVVSGGNQMGHLANRMRSLAATGDPRAEELIEKADELEKLIDADLWDEGPWRMVAGTEAVVRGRGSQSVRDDLYLTARSLVAR